MDYTVHGILQARILEWVAFLFSGGSSQPTEWTQIFRIAGSWIPSPGEPQGKLKNTGVGSLFLLQQIFLTQESNRSLLRCRQILYQLSYEGSSPLLISSYPLYFTPRSKLFKLCSSFISLIACYYTTICWIVFSVLGIIYWLSVTKAENFL